MKPVPPIKLKVPRPKKRVGVLPTRVQRSKKAYNRKAAWLPKEDQ